MWGALLTTSLTGWLHPLTATPHPTQDCSDTACATAKR
jgi:hypothetical protein